MKKARLRVGQGYDIHRLIKGRKLMLGGVEIPFSKGEQGHSDGDVLTHAVIDAIFGAAALGDIGSHFPPADQQYRDISSRILLRKCRELVETAGWRIINIDATVVLQEPKIGGFVREIRSVIASDAGLEADAVSVKGKTAEKTGTVGKGKAVEAHAVCLMIQE